ncbi:MAG TPA: polysaccharide biosynthesis/export family protein [Vicinamibacterales bacterium]
MRIAFCLLALALSQAAAAQSLTATPPAIVPTASDYTIGPDDILTIVFWRHKDLSGDVVVRPDGKVTLPLINDVQAANLTTDQLRADLVAKAGEFVEEPMATVVVKQVNSKKVFITGNVQKAGPYPITSSMTVMQLISLAGGLTEFADKKNISIVRNEAGRAVGFQFNYSTVANRKNLKQNIELKPGDTVIVP